MRSPCFNAQMPATINVRHAFCFIIAHTRLVKYLVTKYPNANHVKQLLRAANITSAPNAEKAEKLLEFMRADPKYSYMPLALDVHSADGLNCVTAEYPVVMPRKVATDPIEPVCHRYCSFCCCYIHMLVLARFLFFGRENAISLFGTIHY